MTTVALVLGVVLIVAVMAGLFGITVNGLGWKGASALWGFSLALTSIVAVGSFLVSYGIEGHL